MGNGMTLQDYQEAAGRTNITRGDIDYLVLGLGGESGEVSQVRKRMRRDGKSKIEARGEIKAELGDTLWYLSQIADEFDLDLEEVATYNLNKLARRFETNTIQGKGEVR